MDKPSNKARRVPRVVRWMLWAALAVVCLAVIVFAAVNSGPGKQRLARFLSDTLSKHPRLDFDVSGVSGTLPGSIHIETFTISDDDGEVLIAHDIAARWSVRSIARKPYHIYDALVERVEVLKRPPLNPDARPLDVLRAIPNALRSARIDRLAIDRIEVAEAIVGRDAVFELHGQLTGRTIETLVADLELKRIDEPTTSATLQLDLGGGASTLGLDARIEDSAFIPAALDLDSNQTFRLTLEGDGASESWDGTIRGTLGEEPFWDAGLDVSMNDTVECRIDGTLYANVLPPTRALEERLGNTVEIKAALARHDDRTIEVPSFSVSGDGNSLTGSLTYDPNSDQITIKSNLDTASLARLAGDPDNPRVQGALKGHLSLDGPLETPSVDLDAELEGEKLLAVTGALDLSEGYGFDLEASAWPREPLLAEQAANAVREGIVAQIEGFRSQDGVLRIDQAHLRAVGADARVSGEYDRAAEELNAEVNIAELDLANLAGLLPENARGTVSLSGQIEGGESGWSATVSGTGSDVHVATFESTSLSLNLDGSGDTWTPANLQNVSVTGHADASALSAGTVAQEQVRFEFEIETPDAETLRITRADLESESAQVRARGDYNIESKGGEFVVEIPRVQSSLLSQADEVGEVEWTAGATAKITTSAETLLAANATFHITDLAGLPEAALALAAERVNGETEITFDEGSLSIESLDLKSTAMSATASGTVDTESKNLDLGGSFRIPDAEVLSAVLDRPTAGEIAGEFSVNGPFDAFQAEVDVEGERLTAGDATVREATLRAELDGLPKSPAGNAQLTLESDTEELTTDATFAMTDSLIDVSNIQMRAGENRLQGSGTFDTSVKQGSGSITGNFDNLSTVGELLGIDVAGEMQLSASLDGSGDAQRMHADINGSNLQYQDTQLQTLHLTADATDPFGEMRIDGEANGAGLRTGEANLASFSVQLDGDKEQATLTLAVVEGTIQESKIALDARLVGSINDAWIEVAALDATVGEHAIALQGDARINQEGEVLSASISRLAVDDGTVSFRGNRAEGDVRVTAELDDLPLSLIAAFGGTDLEGTVGGTVQLRGPASQPVGNGNLVFRNVREPGAAYPPVEIRLDTELSQGVTETRVQIAMNDQIEADATLRIPVQFSLQPVEVAVNRQRPIRGQCTANADLSVFPLLFDLQDHVVRGQVNAELQIAGNISEPEVTGEATVVDARYENLETGTILEDLRVVIEGRNRELTVTEFAATDGVGGTLNAEGKVDVLPRESFPFSLDARLGNLRVASRDDLTGQVDGTLSVAGDMERAEIDGSLAIGPATVVLPNKGRVEYPELEVTEVGDPDGEVATAAPDAEDEKKTPIEIALNVDCAIPGKVYVRNQSLDTEWKGNLQVAGTADAPEITGTLSPVRGQIYFLDRTFELQESTITLDGSSPPSPYLDLNASTRTADLTAQLHLYGVYPDVKLELQSDPALPEDEILARLLFDRDLSDITAFQAVQLTAMLESMRGNDGLSA
ncbi:MAG: translocation/assembly module TamB domain-containing protein, partial [Candidatus Hydrogenedentes bacterium]|nr:translocation/assembly module TamB domain-containing protein [Candidatus Hydrogenedentota bacterium]